MTYSNLVLTCLSLYGIISLFMGYFPVDLLVIICSLLLYSWWRLYSLSNQEYQNPQINLVNNDNHYSYIAILATDIDSVINKNTTKKDVVFQDIDVLCNYIVKYGVPEKLYISEYYVNDSMNRIFDTIDIVKKLFNYDLSNFRIVIGDKSHKYLS